MAKGGEAIMGGSGGMSPRKAMGMGKGDGGGNFGVESYEKAHGGPSETHPDRVAGTGSKGMMADGDRGIGGAIQHTKGQLPAQASPNHGPTHPGGHMASRGHSGSGMKV